MILQLVALLKRHDVKHVVISPGSRHYPLVRSLEVDRDFTLYSIVDERSAAFFALGLIQQTGRPVAVACTSGTSVLNYASAVAEAYYQDLPLLLLTADRLPELLGQMEDQMFQQATAFDGFIRHRTQLSPIRSEHDAWNVNRRINEALLELERANPGPVHINYPIEDHSRGNFLTPSLPEVRVIERFDNLQVAELAKHGHDLNGRKVLLIWGQSKESDEELNEALSQFVRAFDVVILADNLSNLRHEARISDPATFFRAMAPGDKSEFAPDVVVTMFGNFVFSAELRGYLRGLPADVEHWLVRPDGAVVDPFRRLTRVYQTEPLRFFEGIAAGLPAIPPRYQRRAREVSGHIPKPKASETELAVIGDLMSMLPKGSALHVANSLPIRMAQLFPVPDGVTVHANRGINGIDGCVSTAVGYAAAATNLTFLVVGDLTFFYDMNALWNRYRASNLRILIVNNSGGGVMQMPLDVSLSEVLATHITAAHDVAAGGWVESLGIPYRSESAKGGYGDALAWLTEETTGPRVLEIHTDRDADVVALKEFYRSADRTPLRAKIARRLRRLV